MNLSKKAIKAFEEAHLQATVQEFLRNPAVSSEDLLFGIWENATHKLFKETTEGCPCQNGDQTNCFLNLPTIVKKQLFKPGNIFSFEKFLDRHQKGLQKIKKQSLRLD